MLTLCTLFVPCGKGLKEMFELALIKIRAKSQVAVHFAVLPGTSHILSNRKA